jgi:hypothetical protein
MTTKPCPVEPLVSSEYCRLTLCPECGIVNLNLPYRISFQFEIHQFLGIAHTFTQGAQILNGKALLNQNIKGIENNRKH